MMQLLEIYKGGEVVGFTQVDDVDALWAKEFKWHLANGYAARGQRRGADRKPYRMYLHREILGLKHAPRSEGVVDHVDGDPMNNLRDNLRVVTDSENSQNRKSRDGSTSKYSGVSWYTSKGCWRVAIMVNGKRTLVGYFDDEEEAGKAAENFREANSPGWVRRTGTALVGDGQEQPLSESAVLVHTDPEGT
jgi:hypothetical protein